MILSAKQRRLLTFYLRVEAERVRAKWLALDGSSLGPVQDHAAPPADAARLMVYATLAHGIELEGADQAYRVIDVRELPALAGLWAEPLRSLTAEGLALARDAADTSLTETFRTPDRTSPETFKASPITSTWLNDQAKREGRNKTAIILDALALYRASFGTP